MRSSKPSAPKFNSYSHRGFIAKSEAQFTSGFTIESDGFRRAVDDEEVVREALRIVSRKMNQEPVLSNPRVVREYLALRFAGLEHEVFACIYLNNARRPIACEELFRGTIDGTSVHPREVAKRALAHNASSIILAHNHPAGVAEPSRADEMITRRLVETLALLDISVLDHFVVVGSSAQSMAERGLF